MLTTIILSVLISGERDWKLVHSDILHGISGMALVESQDSNDTFLIVHDNKKAGESRAALIKVQRGASPEYKALTWEGELPIDLEGLTTIPGSKDGFLCASSSGSVYVVNLNPERTKVTVTKSFKVPGIPDGANFEGISLQILGEQLVMVWGNRGDSPASAQIFIATTDAALTPPTNATNVSFTVPWPASKGTRGISDLKIDPSGTLFVTAAIDAGDDGPFQSAFFIAGVVNVTGGLGLRMSAASRLFWTDQHKIEAFELVPGKTGGLIFGTDDENLGGSVWNNFWPE